METAHARDSTPCTAGGRAVATGGTSDVARVGSRIMLTAMRGVPPTIVGVVLAAGKSTRMGRRKASLDLDGSDTFLTRLVRTFIEAGVEETVVVLGADRAALEVELERSGLAAKTTFNADFEQGQLSSLIAGLNAATAPERVEDGAPWRVEAVLLGLVDAPLVSARTVRAVIDRYLETGAAVVRPVRERKHGHPVLIDRSLFDAIRRADPATGAKPIVRAHVSASGEVEIDDEAAFMDIDTPEAHDRAIQWWRSQPV